MPPEKPRHGRSGGVASGWPDVLPIAKNAVVTLHVIIAAKLNDDGTRRLCKQLSHFVELSLGGDSVTLCDAFRLFFSSIRPEEAM